jgi:hypothetical protein
MESRRSQKRCILMVALSVSDTGVVSNRWNFQSLLIRSLPAESVTLCKDRIVSGWNWGLQEEELVVVGCSKALLLRNSLVLHNKQTLLLKKERKKNYDLFKQSAISNRAGLSSGHLPVYLITGLYRAQVVQLGMVGWFVNDELERMWKAVGTNGPSLNYSLLRTLITAQIVLLILQIPRYDVNVLYGHSFIETGKNHGKLKSG